jgi:predicted nucleic acid-binding protein
MAALPLPTLPAGEEILIDANVIVYAIGQRSRQCAELIGRTMRGEVVGFSTVEIINDACHRLMLSEAAGRGLIARANASNLKGKPQVVRQLGAYWQHVEQTLRGLAILPFDEYRLRRAHAMRLAHGLMANDSLVLAAVNLFGIASLATNDADFFGIPWLTIYRPTDLP